MGYPSPLLQARWFFVTVEVDLIRTLINFEVEEQKKHERRDDLYHVTDVLSCPLKREFELKYPELKATLEPQLVLGRLIHIAFQAILEKEYGAQIEVRKDVTISDNKGNEYEITGRIDAIIGKVGVEIKFSRADFSLPYEHHVMQAKAYNWLFDLDKTILIYFTPDRIAPFVVEDKLEEKDVIRLLTNKNTPKFNWERKYCDYAKICPYKVTNGR